MDTSSASSRSSTVKDQALVSESKLNRLTGSQDRKISDITINLTILAHGYPLEVMTYVA